MSWIFFQLYYKNSYFIICLWFLVHQSFDICELFSVLVVNCLIWLISEPGENVKEILRNVVGQHGVPSSRKTAYLNSFVKLIKHVGYDGNLGMPVPDIVSWFVLIFVSFGSTPYYLILWFSGQCTYFFGFDYILWMNFFFFRTTSSRVSLTSRNGYPGFPWEIKGSENSCRHPCFTIMGLEIWNS